MALYGVVSCVQSLKDFYLDDELIYLQTGIPTPGSRIRYGFHCHLRPLGLSKQGIKRNYTFQIDVIRVDKQGELVTNTKLYPFVALFGLDYHLESSIK